MKIVYDNPGAIGYPRWAVRLRRCSPFHWVFELYLNWHCHEWHFYGSRYDQHV